MYYFEIVNYYYVLKHVAEKISTTQLLFFKNTEPTEHEVHVCTMKKCFRLRCIQYFENELDV